MVGQSSPMAVGIDYGSALFSLVIYIFIISTLRINCNSPKDRGTTILNDSHEW